MATGVLSCLVSNCVKRKHIVFCSAIILALLAALAAAWAAGLITFFSPAWLAALLALPLSAALAVRGISGLPSRTNAISLGLRCLLFIVLAACLAEIQIVLKNRGLCVLYLLDHSASIPDAIAGKELAYAKDSTQYKGKEDTVGIVIFGENASVEIMPVRQLKMDRIYSFVGKDHTDLQNAVELATAAFPADVRKKLVLITDGNENKGNLIEAVEYAAGNGVVVDILPVGYEYQREVLMDKVYLPDSVKEHETFDLRVHVISLQDCAAELSIARNGVNAARQPVNLKKGNNAYTFSMKLDEPGFHAFTARVDSPADTIQANNEASGSVYIQGTSRVLLVSPTRIEVDPLALALRADNIEADLLAPQELPESLGLLQNHDCIVLANVPSDDLSENQMTMLQANVRDLGVGLVMLGGENSFGAGGYENTPIEDVLPVTMDIQQKKINPKGALVLILHTCEFPDGNYWAKQISKKAIDAVNPDDEVGVLLYGTGGEQWLFELTPARDKQQMYAKIDQATPGDMPSFEPTIKMAHAALAKSTAMVKHVIIISDGDPASPQPSLVKDMAKAGMTISTVAINPHSPRDVDVMKYLAQTTGGRYYFAQDPSVLPKIFVKEAKVVKRSLIFNQEFRPQLALSTELTKGIAQPDIPTLMAYVATTPKPRALVPLVSDNENRDPVFAYWRHGLGKSIAFTSDATSNWGKHWVTWDKYGKFWTQAIRWASRKREESVLRMHTEIQGGRGKLVVDAVDPRGNFINFLRVSGRMVNPRNQGASLDIRQSAPGRYEADFDADTVGVSIINVGYQNPQTGGQGFVATGVSIPYSPEYRQFESNFPLLRRAAATGGGRLLSGNPAEDRVFASSLPPTLSHQPVWQPLLLAALILFLLDVVIRRVIVTRRDVASALARAGRLFAFRHRALPQDQTMAALLRRKAKTFERVRKPEAASGDFQESIHQEAARRRREGTAPPAVPVETAEETRPGEAGPERPAPPPAGQPAEPGKPGEETYTGRLLAAKKRVQKKGQES